MTEKISGQCLCGATAFRADGPPKFAIVCYCTDCQHATGSGHAPQLGLAVDNFDIAGPLKSFDTQSESGSELSFKFCSDCGSPIAKTTSKAPTTVFVYAGALDNPAQFPNDAMHVFEESRQPWDA